MIPSLFIAHGAPSLALEKHDYTTFLNDLGLSMPKPRAVVLFTAHWESSEQLVSGASTYETIYDFGGFQRELYEVKYPAPGHPSLADEIRGVFEAAGIPASIDSTRGLDHGAWVVLHLMYPAADIPVIALSVNRHLANEEQYRIGKTLAALREQQILVIGSGGTVHNLRRVNWEAAAHDEWALEFDQWLEDKLTSWDTEALFQYEKLAPYAEAAVPTPEHFIPLLLAMGAGDTKRQATKLFRNYQYGNLSLSCWKFD
ncbi:dioxygenase [Paenibacillus sp. ACRRX]|uniref:DODA-type extradiol aromatic ring-opening family dioxygenase n=1 Tax=unclassified Paenibacillus TaxID=185978 RepID=UPI001EF536D2|nr:MULTISPECIES: class III extradiol ring-cleavage dioxygenase [unclassified Paenibacillus]MCG7408725.1 dioxygenase [Paenibacillus sp. ACRRX]MDK8183492.1 class III extradiol ring-cleavage dioxygenase [Paenibacillus sp. UMB4589-SE434]